MIDEIAIRQQIDYVRKRYYGYDLGINKYTDSDHPPQAKNALVFTAVAINDHWKVPLGYFLIQSLSGKERGNLLEKCLELIHDSGIIVRSITFDGASVNISKCTSLSANFNIGKNFKLYFTDPATVTSENATQ